MCNLRRKPEVETLARPVKQTPARAGRLIAGAVPEREGTWKPDTHRRRKPAVEVRAKRELSHRPSRKMGLQCELKIASRSMMEGGTRARARVRRHIESRRAGIPAQARSPASRPSRKMGARAQTRGLPAGHTGGTQRLAQAGAATGGELKGFRFDAKRRGRRRFNLAASNFAESLGSPKARAGG